MVQNCTRDDSVTMEKLADLAQGKVIGRKRLDGTGDPQALSYSDLWDILADGASVANIYRADNAVGAVEQLDGNSVGALFQKGSNANGSYLRLASGDQFCWNAIAFDATIAIAHFGGFRSPAETWTFPSPFIAAPTVFAVPGTISAFGAGTGSPATATDIVVYATAVTSQTTDTRRLRLLAIGQWY